MPERQLVQGIESNAPVVRVVTPGQGYRMDDPMPEPIFPGSTPSDRATSASAEPIANSSASSNPKKGRAEPKTYGPPTRQSERNRAVGESQGVPVTDADVEEPQRVTKPRRGKTKKRGG
jgi:hypothetical protein